MKKTCTILTLCCWFGAAAFLDQSEAGVIAIRRYSQQSNDGLIKRFDLLDFEFAQLINPHKLSHQRSLVTKYGTLDILGDLHQLPNGAIDSRDFGHNLHDKDDAQIMTYEKEKALERIQDTIMRMIAERIEERIRIKTNPNIARFIPVWILH